MVICLFWGATRTVFNNSCLAIKGYRAQMYTTNLITGTFNNVCLQVLLF